MGNDTIEDLLIVFLWLGAFIGISYIGGMLLEAFTGLPYGLGVVVVPICIVASILMVLLTKFRDYIKK
ncbi:MAG: hypothetical protein RR840_04215 [Clostridium sp.]